MRSATAWLALPAGPLTGAAGADGVEDLSALGWGALTAAAGRWGAAWTAGHGGRRLRWLPDAGVARMRVATGRRMAVADVGPLAASAILRFGEAAPAVHSGRGSGGAADAAAAETRLEGPEGDLAAALGMPPWVLRRALGEWTAVRVLAHSANGVVGSDPPPPVGDGGAAPATAGGVAPPPRPPASAAGTGTLGHRHTPPPVAPVEEEEEGGEASEAAAAGAVRDADAARSGALGAYFKWMLAKFRAGLPLERIHTPRHPCAVAPV